MERKLADIADGGQQQTKKPGIKRRMRMAAHVHDFA